MPGWLMNALELCWSLACQGAQIHSWLPAPGKTISARGGGFAEESPALLSEMDFLQGQPGAKGGDVREPSSLLC